MISKALMILIIHVRFCIQTLLHLKFAAIEFCSHSDSYVPTPFLTYCLKSSSFILAKLSILIMCSDNISLYGLRVLLRAFSSSYVCLEKFFCILLDSFYDLMINRSLRERDRVKDDAIVHLSNQL
jgi:hypothetical protein